MPSNLSQYPGQPAHTVPILIATFGQNIDRLLNAVLSLEGYETAIAVDGQDALDRLVAKKRAHIVMVDVFYELRYGEELDDYLVDPTRRAPHRLIALAVEPNVPSIRVRDQPDALVVQPFNVEELIASVERVERLMCAPPDAPLGFTIDM